MGGPIQKISERRGGKKRKAVSLLCAVPLLLSYAGLIGGMPLRKPLLWFPSLAAVFSLYAVMYGFSGSRGESRSLYKTALFLTSGLMVSGLLEFASMSWLYMLYIPLVILSSVFLDLAGFAAVLVSVPIFEIKSFFRGSILDETIKTAAVYISGAAAYLSYYGLKKRAEAFSASIKSMRDDAIESLDREDLISQSISLRVRSDEEMAALLSLIKKVLRAGSASLFLVKGGDLSLRLSTEQEEVAPSGVGVIQMCVNKKQPALIGSADRYNPGYTKTGGKISSMAAAPVMDGGISLGVLVIDSENDGAFKEHEMEALEGFSGQIARMLKNERVYLEIERSHYALRVLHEEGSGFLSSLSLDHIAGKAVEGASRIAPLRAALLLKGRGGFYLAKETGLALSRDKKFSLKGTLLDVAVKNRGHHYISDLRDYTLPALPFDAGVVNSAFMLPLIYESEPLGILVLVSEDINPLTPYQIELLEVLGNQASMSLANAKLHAEIEKMATTDGLTGLFNHRHFQERFNEEIKKSGRFPKPLSLLLIDIDFFKKVNDTYGHPAGDAVLRAVAKIIKKTVRDTDIPARYGGEEFAALLVGSEAGGARQTAQRLRQNVETSEFRFEDLKLKVTVSIGFASMPLDAQAKEELIEKADKALYQAKRSGRNRVVMWAEESSKLP